MSIQMHDGYDNRPPEEVQGAMGQVRDQFPELATTSPVRIEVRPPINFRKVSEVLGIPD